MTKKYYPHNIEAVHQADNELLSAMCDAFSVAELIDLKMTCYEIPSSVFCLIRTYNQANNKVKEYTYQRKHAADRKLKQLLTSTEPLEVALLTEENYVVLVNKAAAPYPF